MLQKAADGTSRLAHSAWTRLLSAPGYPAQRSDGISDPLISATSERRQPTPIIQICARPGLCRHAALGMQIGGYTCASSACGGSGVSWAQRIAGGMTAPPLPAAVPPARSGLSSEGPSDLFWHGWPPHLPYGGSTRFYGGSTRRHGHLGWFAGVRLRCGNSRTAGGFHHACQIMERRGADAAVRSWLQLDSG